MDADSLHKLTRTAGIIAVAVILQSLRLLFPVPPQVSMFLIGSLVNMCLVLAVRTINVRAGLITATVVPVFAWLEGMLPFLPFVFPVAAGNTAFVFLVGRAGEHKPQLFLAAPAKALVLYGAFRLLFAAFPFPEAVMATLLFIMSWPHGHGYFGDKSRFAGRKTYKTLPFMRLHVILEIITLYKELRYGDFNGDPFDFGGFLHLYRRVSRLEITRHRTPLYSPRGRNAHRLS
ncbi:hypothetical protein [Anaeroglobus geminatus]|uniref:ECF transporter S component n=1 Tax=Anaeroglobus geminatus F0357 TaxID=861450 RepID=G9YHA9_9FIRM|nr:hypothetical protein [Anaeroglobus geminatus]EHM41165.1 hypothetical protein HMPREF0080_01037 [Anaeroglobus geminatus F0357]